MEKLTPSMLQALQRIDGPGNPDIRFQTGEALRKRGLADRLSTYVIKREYVSKDDVTQQFSDDISAKNPVVWHEWYITRDGRAALAKGDSQ